jgi:hypothetical protein
VKIDYVMGEEVAGTAGAGARWLTLTPPGGGPDIAKRGIKPNNDIENAPWGRWFGLDDPDGNNWLVVSVG